MKIYLAGGMQSGWQKTVKNTVEGHTYYDPCTHGLDEWHAYSAWDFGMVADCDWVFGYFEKSNPSGFGLVGEMSYGKGLGKRVIFVDEISAASEPHNRCLRLFEWLADAYFTDLYDGLDFLSRLPV